MMRKDRTNIYYVFMQTGNELISVNFNMKAGPSFFLFNIYRFCSYDEWFLVENKHYVIVRTGYHIKVILEILVLFFFLLLCLL